MPSKTKPKATKPKDDDKQKEQSERFKQTAWELGVDESGKHFQSVLDIVLPKRAAKPK